MQSYIAIVHQDEGSAFGVQFPDVPGCFSAADDMDVLLSNASEALALHLEDEEVPMARPLEVIRTLPEVKQELAEGAFLIAVPHISLAGRKVKANITLDAGLLDAIDQTAGERGLTRSSFFASLARREIGLV